MRKNIYYSENGKWDANVKKEKKILFEIFKILTTKKNAWLVKKILN